MAEPDSGHDRRSRVPAAGADERFLKHLLTVSPVVIYNVRPHGDFATVYISDTIEKLLGYRPEHFLNDPSFGDKRVHPEDVERYRAAFDRVVRDGNSIMECRMCTRSAGYRWFRHELHLIRDEQGEPAEVVGCMVDITKEKEAEEQLRQKTELLELALQASNNGIWDWDIKAGEVWFSPRCKEMLGYSDDAPLTEADAWGHLAEPEDREMACRLMEDFLEGRVPNFETTVRLRHKDGSVRHILDRALLVRDADGAPSRVVGAHFDLTDKLQAAEQLRQSEQRFKDFADATSDWLWETDADLRYTYFSERLVESAGVDPASVLGRTREELAAEDTSCPKWRAHLDDLRHRRPFRDFEYRTRGKEEQQLHVRVSGMPIFAADGSFLGYRGTTANVTAEREAEETLRLTQARAAHAEQVLAEAIESLSEGFVLLDAERRFVMCNDRYRRFYPRVAHLMTPGTPFATIIEESVRSGEIALAGDLDAYLAGRLDSGREHNVLEERMADGRWIRVSDHRTKDGGIVGIRTDITERKRVEGVLREETRTLGLLNRTGAALAAELDLDRLMQMVTDAATQLAGAEFGAFFYNATDENGDAYTLYTLSGAPREAFPFPPPRKTGVFGPTFRGEGVVRVDDITKDSRYGRMPPHHGLPEGHPPVRSYMGVPVISRSGEVLGGILFGHGRPGVFTKRAERIVAGMAAQTAIAIDNARLYQSAQREIARRKRAEADLRLAKEQAEAASRSKSAFLASMSHELRTPLNAVIGFSDMIARQMLGPVGDARYAEYADDIHRSGSHLLALINDLLDMAKIEAGKLELDEQVVDLTRVVEDLLRLTHGSQPDVRNRIETAFDTPTLKLRADPRALKQILFNLVGNAIKFTPAPGTIRVQAGIDAGDPCIVVEDTGIGIPEERVGELGQPFTQVANVLTRSHHGSGMGLFITKSLVELHGGSLQIRSAVGVGTRITVRLPKGRVLAG